MPIVKKLPFVLIAVSFTQMFSFEARSDKFTDESLNQMLRQSAAVVVGTVFEIDENLFDEEIGPQTKYTIMVEEVLYGNVETDFLEVIMLGGLMPGGELRRSFSAVTDLPIGETFILFFRDGDYVYSPFSKSRNSILRIDESGKKPIVTDVLGHLVGISRTLGDIYTSNKAAKTVGEIAASQLETGQSNSSLVVDDSYLDNANSAEEICAFIKEKAAKEEFKSDKKIKAKLKPKAFFNAPVVEREE